MIAEPSQSSLGGYFDYNATTPMSEAVIQALRPCLGLFANPSSNSRLASESKRVLQEARQNVAELLGAHPEQIFFTSGGSESNNWAIKGTALKNRASSGHILTTAIEHPSVLEPIRYCEEHFGFDTTFLTPDRSGVISASQVRDNLRPDTQLVSIMFANNETGTIQPIEKIAAITRSRGIPLHVDAVQLVGKKQVDLSLVHADLVSVSAHKFYGPKGIGCLFVREPENLVPIIHGGGQEAAMRSGTENLFALLGFAKAAREATSEIDSWSKSNWKLKKMLVDLLCESGLPFQINGNWNQDQALTNTLNISIQGIRGEALALRLETKHNIQISIGSACSNNKQANHSHVLTAMGLSEAELHGAIRISFGRHTNSNDVKRLVAALNEEVQALRSLSGK